MARSSGRIVRVLNGELAIYDLTNRRSNLLPSPGQVEEVTFNS
jgi:hypothetical protein